MFCVCVFRFNINGGNICGVNENDVLPATLNPFHLPLVLVCSGAWGCDYNSESADSSHYLHSLLSF